MLIQKPTIIVDFFNFKAFKSKFFKHLKYFFLQLMAFEQRLKDV